MLISRNSEGYMVRERLGIPVTAREGRDLVEMASERSCSITMSDHRVVSQYHSFVIILDRAGATLSALDKGAVLIQHCT